MSTITKNIIIEELNSIPDEVANEILDFIKFLKTKTKTDKTTTHIASIHSLSKDWEKPKEDEAWNDL